VGGSWMIDKTALAKGDWEALGSFAEQQIRV
jgi:2-keto-3-deoxy-6-phosphogluconate aldolase